MRQLISPVNTTRGGEAKLLREDAGMRKGQASPCILSDHCSAEKSLWLHAPETGNAASVAVTALTNWGWGDSDDTACGCVSASTDKCESGFGDVSRIDTLLTVTPRPCYFGKAHACCA
eukprot:TRINITY_DN54697_c0_g1_i1.p1 TRINITY_DN54697_c0_g1~~TRINITY_DN54697_c0_g1_i1.p1  ORF type:complete len:118 (-),score=5.54 TRINITY_DN54697_c0_g1_i1:532-885(-)